MNISEYGAIDIACPAAALRALSLQTNASEVTEDTGRFQNMSSAAAYFYCFISKSISLSMWTLSFEFNALIREGYTGSGGDLSSVSSFKKKIKTS